MSLYFSYVDDVILSIKNPDWGIVVVGGGGVIISIMYIIS